VTQLVDEGNPHLRTAEIAERAEVDLSSLARSRGPLPVGRRCPAPRHSGRPPAGEDGR
jgi:hypothetical protein